MRDTKEPSGHIFASAVHINDSSVLLDVRKYPPPVISAKITKIATSALVFIRRAYHSGTLRTSLVQLRVQVEECQKEAQ